MQKKDDEHIAPWQFVQNFHSSKFEELGHSQFIPSISVPINLTDPISNSVTLKSPKNIKSLKKMFSLQDSKLRKKKIQMSVIQIDKCLQQNQSLVKRIKNLEQAKLKLMKKNEELVVIQFIRGQLKKEKRGNKPEKTIQHNYESLFPVLENCKGNCRRSINELLFPPIL